MSDDENPVEHRHLLHKKSLADADAVEIALLVGHLRVAVETLENQARDLEAVVLENHPEHPIAAAALQQAGRKLLGVEELLRTAELLLRAPK